MSIENLSKPRVIHHGQGNAMLALDGLAGENLVLRYVAQEVYEWKTEDNAALDLELRAQLVSTTVDDEKSPLVFWRVEYGHGGAMYSHPPARVASALSEYQRPIVPARGLVLRLSARTLRVYFNGGIDTLGNAVAENKINVSVQPSTQSRRLPFPYALRARTDIDDARNPFPMDANEFRVRDDIGAPFIIGACTLSLWGIVDEPLATADVATNGFGDWSPIPPLAASLALRNVSDFATVEFR